MRSDLSELKPLPAAGVQQAPLVGWPDLASAYTRPRARMLGYMMDGYEPSADGAQVEMFILLPDAGQFMHPAHREPGQMVEISLTHAVPFNYRRLVWVSGSLGRTSPPGDPDKASYAMTDAESEPAVERDITRSFTP